MPISSKQMPMRTHSKRCLVSAIPADSAGKPTIQPNNNIGVGDFLPNKPRWRKALLAGARLCHVLTIPAGSAGKRK